MASEPGGGSIDSVLHESRVFSPPAEFARKAHIKGLDEYQALWDRAQQDPEGFWAEQAGSMLDWATPWNKVLDWNPPFAKWFVGGTMNVAHNCIDRHADGPNAEKPAIIWEGEPGDRRTLSYKELRREVARFANVLKGLGVQPGDVVAIYMPMVPEAAIAMLACAGSAPRTRSSSAASAPRPWPGGSRTATPR